MLGFKHFEEKAHKAENNQNKQTIAEKMHVLWDIDFEGIEDGFWEGFGRPKSSIFAIFSSSDLDFGASWVSKSAALLAAPGVLDPTAFYACINILLLLP